MWSRSKFTRALTGGVVAAGSTLFAIVAPVGAQTSASQTCVSQDINQQFFIGGPSQSAVFPIAIPAGTVSIPSATARDFYPDRATAVGQLSEKWQIQFLAADGSVVATSEPTVDVPDGQDDQSWTGSLPDVTLSGAVSGIRIIHRPDLPTTGAAMSVWANGVTLCWPLPATPVVCPPDAAGNPVTPGPDGTCPTPPPSGPVLCGTNAAGDPVAPNPDGTCPTPPPTVPRPTNCGTDGAGNPIATKADGTCSIPDPAGPSLPVTGLGSTLLVALAGLFTAAAGFSLVLRPRAVDGLD